MSGCLLLFFSQGKHKRASSLLIIDGTDAQSARTSAASWLLLHWSPSVHPLLLRFPSSPPALLPQHLFVRRAWHAVTQPSRRANNKRCTGDQLQQRRDAWPLKNYRSRASLRLSRATLVAVAKSQFVSREKKRKKTAAAVNSREIFPRLSGVGSPSPSHLLYFSSLPHHHSAPQRPRQE